MMIIMRRDRANRRSHAHSGRHRTWGKALLELLGLLGILKDEGVEVSVASDLELDLVGLGALLYPGSCYKR